MYRTTAMQGFPLHYVTPDGFKLGSWVSDQRKNKSKNLLSQDRIERLEALPGWSWDPFTEQWEEAFGQLQSYVKLAWQCKGSLIVMSLLMVLNLGVGLATNARTNPKISLARIG